MNILRYLLLLSVLILIVLSCDRGPEGDQIVPGSSNFRLGYLPTGDQVVILWLDDERVAEDLTATWFGERGELTAGPHQARVTTTATPPAILFQENFELPAGGDYSYVITEVEGEYDGQLVPDSNLAVDNLAVIRLVNLHRTDTVAMGLQYMRLIEYAGYALPGECMNYGTVLAPPDPPEMYSGSVALLFHAGYFHPVPVDSFEAGAVYSVYATGADPDLDSEAALRTVLIEDY